MYPNDHFRRNKQKKYHCHYYKYCVCSFVLPFRYHFDNIEDCFRSEAKFLNFMQKLTATHSLKAITIRHPKSNTVKHFLTVNDGTTCKHFAELDSGCGSVARAVASNTRGLQFESSHRQFFIQNFISVNCIETTKMKKKRLRMAHIKYFADLTL